MFIEETLIAMTCAGIQTLDIQSLGHGSSTAKFSLLNLSLNLDPIWSFSKTMTLDEACKMRG